MQALRILGIGCQTATSPGGRDVDASTTGSKSRESYGDVLAMKHVKILPTLDTLMVN